MARTRMKNIAAARYTKMERDPKSMIRFLSKVLLVPGRLRTPCWEWTGYRDENGYPQVKLHGRAWWAHRVSYALFIRTISEGREIDHRCRNPSCVNPAHLRARGRVAHARDSGAMRGAEMRDEIPI